MSNEKLRKVDHMALNTNQALIITLNVIAFILDTPWLAAMVTLAMLIGTIGNFPGFKFVYLALKPTGWPKPNVLLDNPEPHRFAQGFGAVVMIGGTVSLFTGASVLGWILVWVVTALAALNLFGGFCVGCAVYYWLNRLNAPGFTKSPPPDTFPGTRPKVEV